MYTLEQVRTIAKALPKERTNTPGGPLEAMYAYSRDGKTPSCIAGAICHALQPDLLEHLAEWNESWNDELLPNTFEPDASGYLEVLQEQADQGLTWGSAVEFVESNLRTK